MGTEVIPETSQHLSYTSKVSILPRFWHPPHVAPAWRAKTCKCAMNSFPRVSPEWSTVAFYAYSLGMKNLCDVEDLLSSALLHSYY